MLPDGPVEAVVVWCDGNLCGGRFTQPISDAAIEAALLRSQLVSGDLEEPEARADRGAAPAAPPLGIAAAYPRIFTATAGAVLAMLVLLLVLLASGVLPYTPGLTS